MNRRLKITYIAFCAISFFLVGLFAVWWFNPSHIPTNFKGYARVLDYLFFLLVTYVIWHPIMMEVLSWAIAWHVKDVRHQKPVGGLRVAFLTTFVPASESIDLLHKTLPAMVRASYRHDTWLLDEGDDPAVKDLCKKYGVKHYSRRGKQHYNMDEGKFAKKTKGGNHNSWYDMHGDDYDIVAQIDTDFIPDSSFLIKTLGYFRDPRVAFVGTPQIYGNTNDSFIARGAAEQTYSFYGPTLRGLYGLDMTLLIGANHVIRTAALKNVDHYSAHITEDLLTGMKLHTKGWKSVYVHEALAIGEGPSTWKSYFNQQMRWAYGCIDILFHHSPKLFKNMSLRSALYYYFLQQYYFSGLAMMLGIAGVTLYFLFGIDTAVFPMLEFLRIYLPVLTVCVLMGLWLQRFNVRPTQERGLMIAGKIISVAAAPIFFLAFLGVLRGKRLTYKVTPKGKGHKAKHALSSLHVFKPHFVIGSITCSGFVSSFFTHRQSFIMLFWAVSNTVLMFSLPFIDRVSMTTWRVLRRMYRYTSLKTLRVRQVLSI